MKKYWWFLSLAYGTDDQDNPNGIIKDKLEWMSDDSKFSLGIECCSKKVNERGR